MAFLQRLIGYLANEVLVKGLAESQTFQRAAVAVNEASKVAQAQGAELAKSAAETSRAFTKEVEKELAKQGGKQGGKPGGGGG